MKFNPHLFFFKDFFWLVAFILFYVLYLITGNMKVYLSIAMVCIIMMIFVGRYNYKDRIGGKLKWE